MKVTNDEPELTDVLDKLEYILDNNAYDDCIMGGDFNFDPSRSTGFVNSVKEFLAKVGLLSVWEKFPIDFTHIHTDMKSFSTLDHFFVNQRLLEIVTDAGVLHLGDNLSRHSPIVMKVKLPDLSDRAKVSDDLIQIRRPAWYKATDEDRNAFRTSLESKLNAIRVPESLYCVDIKCQGQTHHQDRDSFLLDILCCIVETSYQEIPLSGIKRHQNGTLLSKSLPGWKENIAPLKNDSLFWHSVWISAGRPSSGSLHQVMVYCRWKYHLAINHAKRAMAMNKANSLVTAAESGDRYLFEELRKHIPGKNNGQKVPECVEGKVTHDTILDKFKECYMELYNSADTKEGMKLIKAQLDNLVDDNAIKEAAKINAKAVEQACRCMKAGKSDISSSFTSDAILNGPTILYEHIAAIFRSYLVHSSVSPLILTCAFLPLFKGGFKNPEKFDSYRAIANGSQILKLFEYVIISIWGSCLNTDSMQFGFKQGVSTTQCTWLVNEVANYFVKRGTAVNSCLLDCSKAFDKCKFDKLFQKLIDKGLPPIVIKVLVYVYEEQSGCVKLGGKQSDLFPITNGTRQGSVLSPLLFSIYLDGLLKRLRHLKLGCHIGGYWLGAMGYADDLILLAPTRDVLQQMLLVCESYAVDQNLTLSTDPVPSKSKSKCIYFCGREGRKVKYPEPLKLDGKDLPWVKTADHLGHTLHQLGTMEKDSDRARSKFIHRSMDVLEDLYFANPCQKLKAIQVYCCDAYGSMLWDLGSQYSESFFKCWNSSVKQCYGITRKTFTYLVEDYFASGFTSLRNQVISRYAGFYRKLLKSSSREVCFMANIVAKDPRSVTCKNLRLLQSKTALRQPYTYSTFKIKSVLPVKTVPQNEMWRLGLLSSLLKLRLEKRMRNEATNSVDAMLDSLCCS